MLGGLNKKNYLIYVVFAMLSAGGALYMTENLVVVFYLFLVLSICLIFIYALKNKGKKNKVDSSFDVLVILSFLFIVLFSFFFHNTESRLLEAGGFLMFIFSTNIILSKVIDINTGFKALILSGFFIIAPLLVLPIFIYGLQIDEYGGYRGIFYNSNSYGGISATFLILILSWFIPSVVEKKIKKTRVILILIILGSCFYFLILSGSRASILSAFFVTFLVLMKEGYLNKRVFVKIVFFLIIGIILLINSTLFNKYFIAKFAKKKGDLLDGRSETWSIILQNINLTGHDSVFMKNLPFAPHNTYLSILAQFGIVFLLIYILLILKTFIISFKFTKSNSIYRYIPFAVTMNFMILSMTEGMLMKYSMLIVFLSYSSIYRFIKK